jgi:hypothetical protein
MAKSELLIQMQEYVRTRLRAERAAMGRGGTVELAVALGCTDEHVSNMLHEPPSRSPGEGIMRAAARRWGLTYAGLEEAACGRTSPPPATEEQLRSLIRDELEAALRGPAPVLALPPAPKKKHKD